MMVLLFFAAPVENNSLCGISWILYFLRQSGIFLF